ncbi:nitrite reductase [Nocardioides sp. LHG3406-4]|uniref:nitrite reductase n=1 Tax=Nocardioides sp. LHG3406-4 TaxID=2804575 RepID=UPI003CF6A47E
MPTTSSLRSRPDLCPGVLRPWSADDGALVRLRLVGGRLAPESLAALRDVSGEYGDGDIHLTRRANLQLRGLPTRAGDLLPDVVRSIEATGLLPSRTHELVRNVMVSPQTALSGGRADLRPVAAELDALLCGTPRLARLPGRFLFVLDDGRGDLVTRPTDLGLVALDATSAQLRVGSTGWGPVVELASAARALTDLALRFLDERGDGPRAPWHVDEVARPLVAPRPPEAATAVTCPALPFGSVGGGEHVAAPGGVVDSALARLLVGHDRELVVTPWRGVLVPSEEAR